MTQTSVSRWLWLCAVSGVVGCDDAGGGGSAADGGRADGAVVADAGRADGARPDARAPGDAGPADARVGDASLGDAAPGDASPADAGPADAGPDAAVGSCVPPPGCRAEGPACDGGARVVCALDGDGCLQAVERTPCDAGTVCVVGAGGPACEVGICTADHRLSCADAGRRIPGTTVGGSRVYNNYQGPPGARFYAAEERIIGFADPGFNVARIMLYYDVNVADLDLFGYGDRVACGDVEAEVAHVSNGTGPFESELLLTRPNRTSWLVIDQYDESGMAQGAPYEIEVTCTPVVCGDGNVESWAEACDDGNEDAGDGCSPTCEIEPGFQCVGGINQRSMCSPAPCGDGVIQQPAEACDDGGRAAGDGCDANCRVEFGQTCDGTPSVCRALPVRGPYAPGEAIELIEGGPLAIHDADDWYVAFSADVVLSGALRVTVGIGNADLTISNAEGTVLELNRDARDEEWQDLALPAGLYRFRPAAWTAIDRYTLTLETAAP